MIFLQLWLQDPPAPEEWFYPLVWPFILSSVGCYAYFRGALMESYGSKAAYKVIGIPLCALAFILGCLPAIKYFSDPLYQNIITSGRVKAAHEFGWLFGFGTLAAIFYDRHRRNTEKRKEELFDRIRR